MSLLSSVIWSSCCMWCMGFLDFWVGIWDIGHTFHSCHYFYIYYYHFFFCLWTIISVMATSLIIFLIFIFWECFFLSFNIFCQTASIFTLFLVVCKTHFSSSFFWITSGTDSLSIKAVNSWSISPNFYLKYSLLVVSTSISVSVFNFNFVRSSFKNNFFFYIYI